MEAQVEKYKKLRPIYEDFNERIKDLLKSLIEENKIKYHLIETRTKSLESFKEKIERKSNKYSNPIEEITDLAGIRIIVYYQDDVARIEEIIKNEFIVDDQNSFDKGKLLKTNEFGYQSVHYVVSLSFDRAKLSEWKKYSKFKIEIQIRTVLQHSWASISHELEYKKSYEIPTILQRRLFRLASLIELADEEFKKSKDQHNELVEKISEGKTSNIAQNEILEELNLLTLRNYILNSEKLRDIVTKAINAGFESHNDEKETYLSQIIFFCNQLNIHTIYDFDKLIERIKINSISYFEAIMKYSEYVKWRGSTGFFILLLIIQENKERIEVKDLVKFGWNSEIANNVLIVAKS
jgi:ppGpp synthetase/RelA/SpoT-type nucleotidyltranferase